MTKEEAIEICERWFAFADRQSEKSRRIQELGTLARTEPERARRELAQIDRSPLVFGGDLIGAVKRLVAACRE